MLYIFDLTYYFSSPFSLVMQNFKNVPQYFYGLNPAQMDMFMTEDSPVRRQAEKVTEVIFSFKPSYPSIYSARIWTQLEGEQKVASQRYES